MAKLNPKLRVITETTGKSQTNHKRLQLNRRLLPATQTTEVYFQTLTWFNKFICRPSDIFYYAICFVCETSK